MILQPDYLLAQSRDYITSVNTPGNSYYPTTGGLLHVSELSNIVLRGYYIHTNDQTLYFQSTSEGGVKVWKPDGSTLIQYGGVSHPGFQYATFYNTTFLYDAREDTFSVTSETDQWEDVFKEQNITGVILPINTESIRTVVDKLLSDPHTHLLSFISHALGEVGIVGYMTNSSLPLHIAALSLHQQKMITSMNFNTTRHAWSTRSQMRFTRVHRHKRSCEEYPDREDDCLGMCGPSCTCWKWVCGDCCFHEGCYEHDVCCGKGSIRCLMVFKFTCSSFMSC